VAVIYVVLSFWHACARCLQTCGCYTFSTKSLHAAESSRVCIVVRRRVMVVHAAMLQPTTGAVAATDAAHRVTLPAAAAGAPRRPVCALLGHPKSIWMASEDAKRSCIALKKCAR
jgi:hypothetical protein